MKKEVILYEYSNWIDIIIIEYIEKYIIDNNININDFLKQYGYYITFSFDIKKINANHNLDYNSNNEINNINFKNIRHLYNLICNDVFGRNFMKDDNPLPKVIMCSDVNNTKYWSKMGDISNLHIHSIWISNQNITKDISILIDSIITEKSNMFDFRDVHISKITSFDRTDDNPSTLASYTAKFIPFNTNDLNLSEDIRVLPEYDYKN